MHVLMRKEDAAREAPSDKLRVVTESYSIKIALIGGGHLLSNSAQFF